MKEENKIYKDNLVRFLKDSKSYPHKPESVELIQTHISYIAIAGPYVYKIKKPVDLGFLNFTTLKQRHHFCQREIVLNNRLSNDIYESVAAISKHKDGLAVENNSDIIEYAVKMKRLSPEGFLNKRIERDNVQQQDLDRLIDHLSHFYLEQRSSPEVARCGYINIIKAFIEENFEQTKQFVNDLIPDYAYRAIQEYNKQFFCRYSALLNRRRTDGYILDCHGDLRLEHIHLTEKNVNIFDCIEFNDKLRYIDVASEIAFLAMDLDFHGRCDLSKYFTDKMSDSLDDPDLLNLIDFYKCYRAYVRAKVHSMKSVEPEVPQDQKDKSRNHAVRLYRLPMKYAVGGSEPMVIIIMGRIGTGKSTIAAKLSESLGWDIFSSDIIRKQLASIPLTKHPDKKVREKIYCDTMTQNTYNEILRKALENAERGISSLVDATYGSKKRRIKLIDALMKKNIRFFFVELKAEDKLIKERLKEREDQPAMTSDARLKDFGKLSAGYHSPNALELTNHIVIDTTGPLNKILFDICKNIMLLKPV